MMFLQIIQILCENLIAGLIGGEVKILIVEDEPDMRKALEKGFVKKGFLVDTAEDGLEGSYLALVNAYE